MGETEGSGEMGETEWSGKRGEDRGDRGSGEIGKDKGDRGSWETGGTGGQRRQGVRGCSNCNKMEMEHSVLSSFFNKPKT